MKSTAKKTMMTPMIKWSLILLVAVLPVTSEQLLEPKTTTTPVPVNSTGNETNTTTAKPTEAPPSAPVLPVKGEAEKEHKSSMAIFFILAVIVVSILVVHILLVTEFHYIPESLAIVILGLGIGILLKLTTSYDWREAESFSPNAFFLILLPPIIFEGGYNLHKGNFFANLGSILVFACVGTVLSSIVIGGGVYLLGQADLIYALSGVESMAFGSMISAVDPVATLAIFQALKVDPILYMLVFGESMLNDAVAIVLTNTVLELREAGELSFAESLASSFARFNAMFFGSAGLGMAAGLLSAVLLKHVDLRRTPSLEFGILLVFAYLPYGLAEGLHLSGIMAILFCGIGMSHYTHYNLSPMTQITMTQTFRTLAFVSETCVFAYLGLAFFTFPLVFRPVFIIWSLILCMIGRAVNIFPLSFLVNRFREHQITRKMQFIMWFSGLRGAIAFALSMHMDFDSSETRRMMVTSTLSIVLFTIIVFGGGTLPVMNLLNKYMEAPADVERGRRKRKRGRRRKRGQRQASRSSSRTSTFRGLSKTAELGSAVEPTDCSYGSDSADGSEAAAQGTASRLPGHLSGLAHIDATWLRPFFVRKFTHQEKKESTLKLTDMALEWFQAAEVASESDERHSTSPAAPTLVDLHSEDDRSPLVGRGLI